jgi:hypothetical protein
MLSQSHPIKQPAFLRESIRQRIQVGGIVLALMLATNLAINITGGHAHNSLFMQTAYSQSYTYTTIATSDDTNLHDEQAKTLPEPIFEMPDAALKPTPSVSNGDHSPEAPNSQPHDTVIINDFYGDVPTIAPQPANQPANTYTKTITKTVYEDLPGIWVFPVPNRMLGQKAFADAAYSISAEVAQQLQQSHPDTVVYFPMESIATLKRRNRPLLHRLWEQWNTEGHFHEDALKAAIDSVQGPNGAEISRVVVVKADTDFNEPQKTRNLIDIVKVWHGDDIPDDMRLFVRTRLSVLNTQGAYSSLAWTGAWQHPIKRSKLMNMTSSVYDDTDSQKSFHDAAQIISNVLRVRAPAEALAKPVTVTTTKVIAKRSRF